MSGMRGNMEGMRGAAQVVLNMKNVAHWARFSFSAGGDRWSSAKHEKHAIWACFSCLAGREGEGRHVGMSGIPSGWGRLEGRLATEHEKHAPCGVFFVFGRWEREGEEI